MTITYTLRNRGTATATATAVSVNFGGLTFVSASVAGEFDATTKAWTAGDLAAGATKTIRLTFRAPAAGMFAASAQRDDHGDRAGDREQQLGDTISVGVAIPDVVTPGPKAQRVPGPADVVPVEQHERPPRAAVISRAPRRGARNPDNRVTITYSATLETMPFVLQEYLLELRF